MRKAVSFFSGSSALEYAGGSRIDVGQGGARHARHDSAVECLRGAA